jgi:ketosteroid isomerase-like protein
MKPKEIVQSLLNGIMNPEVVRDLCGQDVTYVSLNFSNPDLHKIMPWCGTSHGVDAISKTFDDVSRYWSIETFTPEAVFGEDEHQAVFGRFTYTSKKLQRTVTTPFAIYCTVHGGKVTYMQFMEDTFATASSFRSGGTWKFQSDPHGGEVEI